MGYPIRLVPGAEILCTPAMVPYARSRRLMTLGDSNRVLAEFSPSIPMKDMEALLAVLEESGYQPIIAHGERYRCLHSFRAA